MTLPVLSQRADAIRNAYQAGSAMADITEAFRVSRETVRRLVGTAGVGRGNAQHGARWTAERIERVKKLWVEGLSASQIASEIGGVPRNAVIGKIHRLLLPRRLDPMRALKTGKMNSDAATASKPSKLSNVPKLKPVEKKLRGDGFKVTNIARRAAAVDPGLEPAVEIAVPISRRISIMELRDGFCRWPLGDPLKPDFVFCGGDCDVARPYCRAHANVAFVAGKDRKAAINSMVKAWPR